MRCRPLSLHHNGRKWPKVAANYATVSDIIAIGKNLTAEEQTSAEILIQTASSKIRIIARKYGIDIDKNISDTTTGDDLSVAVKNAVVQSVIRAIDSLSSTSSAVSQNSETNGAYNISMTYLNAGQSLYFLNNELKDLGIIRQRYGAIDL